MAGRLSCRPCGCAMGKATFCYPTRRCCPPRPLRGHTVPAKGELHLHLKQPGLLCCEANRHPSKQAYDAQDKDVCAMHRRVHLLQLLLTARDLLLVPQVGLCTAMHTIGIRREQAMTHCVQTDANKMLCRMLHHI